MQQASEIGLYGWEFLAEIMMNDKSGLSSPVAMEELFWGDAGIGMAIMGSGLAAAGIAAAAINADGPSASRAAGSAAAGQLDGDDRRRVSSRGDSGAARAADLR